LKGDQEGRERAVARARERSGGDTWISNKEAYAVAYAGQLKKARASSQRAMDQAMQEGQPERAGLWQAGESLREAFFGNASQAKERAIAALKLSNNREVEFGAALALALSGGDDRVQALVDDLERRFPEDTVVRFSYLPVLRARAALNRGDAAKAIELLQAAVPYALGSSRLLFGALYPVYVRGEAHLAAHQGPEAAIEFQKILDHRGVVGSDPIGALAHLQLGRAQALSGDKIKAKAEYQAFLTLWKDADRDIPIFEQAKAEYAELQ
jgi:eukaryotic-like serine/threonine-protein kinase